MRMTNLWSSGRQQPSLLLVSPLAVCCACLPYVSSACWCPLNCMSSQSKLELRSPRACGAVRSVGLQLVEITVYL